MREVFVVLPLPLRNPERLENRLTIPPGCTPGRKTLNGIETMRRVTARS